MPRNPPTHLLRVGGDRPAPFTCRGVGRPSAIAASAPRIARSRRGGAIRAVGAPNGVHSENRSRALPAHTTPRRAAVLRCGTVEKTCFSPFPRQTSDPDTPPLDFGVPDTQHLVPSQWVNSSRGGVRQTIAGLMLEEYGVGAQYGSTPCCPLLYDVWGCRPGKGLLRMADHVREEWTVVIFD